MGFAGIITVVKKYLGHTSFLISYEHLPWQEVTSVFVVRAWCSLSFFLHTISWRVQPGRDLIAFIVCTPSLKMEWNSGRAQLFIICFVWVRQHADGYPAVSASFWRTVSFSAVHIAGSPAPLTISMLCHRDWELHKGRHLLLQRVFTKYWTELFFFFFFLVFHYIFIR